MCVWFVLFSALCLSDSVTGVCVCVCVLSPALSPGDCATILCVWVCGCVLFSGLCVAQVKPVYVYVCVCVCVCALLSPVPW